MHIAFALFADAANISQEGKLNILGVFDALQVAQLPAVHPRATLVVRVKGTAVDVGAHSLGMAWVGPNGNELWGSQGQLDVGTPPNGVNELDFPIIAALDLPLDATGAYTMKLALDGNPAAEIKLMVRAAAALPRTTPGLVS